MQIENTNKDSTIIPRQGAALVDWAVAQGLDLNQPVNESEQTVLHLAAREGVKTLAMAEAMLRAGASLDVKDNQGCTPLDEADRVMRGFLETLAETTAAKKGPGGRKAKRS